MSTTEDKRRAFLISELRFLWLELREAQHDVVAIGSGLKCGAINSDQAVGILHGCGDLLSLLGPIAATATATAFPQDRVA